MTQEKDRDVPSRRWLVAALEALDREGDTVAAAYVAMALHQVERRASPQALPR